MRWTLAFCLLASHAHAAGPVVELRRGDDAPKEIVAWYSSLDRLLMGYQTAMEGLRAHAESGDPEALVETVSGLGGMAGEYGKVTGDSSGSKKAQESIRETKDYYSLDRGSLNRWALLMRQKALETPGPKGRLPANSLLTVKSTATVSELAFLDVSDKPLASGGKILSPALAALVAAFGAVPNAKGAYVVSFERLWLRVAGADVIFDITAAENDGILRVRYSEEDGSALGQSRFYFLTKALMEIGLAVSVQSGELVGTLSGERAGLDAYDRRERFQMAWKIFAAGERLRPLLKGYLKGSVSSEENARRLDILAGIIAVEGNLPFLEDGDGEALRRGVRDHVGQNSARETLRANMSRNLARYRLGFFPTEIGIGQRTIDLYYNAPIGAAIARGELEWTGDSLVAKKGYSPAGRFVREKERVPPTGRAHVFGLVGGALGVIRQRRNVSGDWEEARYVLEPRPAFADERMIFTADVLNGGTKPGTREGIVTYDRKKALAGGKIFVTPYLSPADAFAVSKSLGIVTTSGGTQAAFAAKVAGIPALNIRRAEWSVGSGLQMGLPVFGKKRWSAGIAVRRVVSDQKLILTEGDTVRLDSKKGILEVLDGSE